MNKRAISSGRKFSIANWSRPDYNKYIRDASVKQTVRLSYKLHIKKATYSFGEGRLLF